MPIFGDTKTEPMDDAMGEDDDQETAASDLLSAIKNEDPAGIVAAINRLTMPAMPVDDE